MWRRGVAAVDPDPMWHIALTLWCRYYVRTEDYDRSICAWRRGDTAIPTTPEERRLCSLNALSQREALEREADVRGVSSEMLRAAQDAALGMSEADMRAVLRTGPC